jgi:hypothetical protein
MPALLVARDAVLNVFKRRRVVVASAMIAMVGAIFAATQFGSAQAAEKGVKPIADSCDKSKLKEHDGFQDGNRCVNTEFGEVSDESRNPTLLIVGAPDTVKVKQGFTLKVSTRNLVRDRFLAAADGGYYAETSLLNGQGLTRGHFHTACRMLDNDNAAPEPDVEVDFFVATEDNKGGARPDTVNVQVSGMPRKGTAQCAAWAGDGSHRVPMMQFARQIPAFDVVRIEVE